MRCRFGCLSEPARYAILSEIFSDLAFRSFRFQSIDFGSYNFTSLCCSSALSELGQDESFFRVVFIGVGQCDFGRIRCVSRPVLENLLAAPLAMQLDLPLSGQFAEELADFLSQLVPLTLSWELFRGILELEVESILTFLLLDDRRQSVKNLGELARLHKDVLEVNSVEPMLSAEPVRHHVNESSTVGQILSEVA